MNKFLIVCAACLMAIAGISQQAKAGATTFGYTPGAGTIFAAPTNGSGQLGAPYGTLCDAVAIANCIAVKAASTAAVATDPSAVVQISPSQPQLTTPLNVTDTLNAVGHPDFVQRVAGSTGGSTPYHLGGASVSGTNAHVIDAAPGMLYTLAVINPTTTIAYLRIYNVATTPTCSSGTGVVHDYAIPAASVTGVAGGFVIPYPVGEAYATGISYCLTGAVGDTDVTPAPIGVTLDASYK